MQAMRRILLKLTIVSLLVAALFCLGLNPSAAYAAPCTANTFIDLWAKTGTATLYGSTSVTIWGYSLTSGGAATLPGPALQANQGDCVQVTLHNTLSESSALLFQGQSLIPDTAGASAGGTHVYTFAANRPGTFLYEAGLVPGKQHQVAMGMYGALIVQPTVPAAVDVEQTVVLSEFDATLAANPIGYDMRKYAPKYFLINGKAYPNTASITAAAGNTVLLRYVNAGLQAHAMSTLGVAQKAIAMDGSAFAHPHSMVSETIAPGQTLDALVSIPAAAAAGTKYALYDANLMLRNTSASGLGGMLTFLTVSAGSSGADTTGPLLSSLTLAPNPSNGAVPVALSFTANDTTTGGSTVNAAEYWVDAGAHTPITIGSPATVVALNASIPAGLSHGTHVVSVRAQDSVGNWSTTATINLVVDSVAPTTAGFSLTPNPSNGSVSVTFSFTGNDSASGNSNITAAEYWIDAGAHQSVAVASPAPVKTLTVSLSPPFSVGTHTVSARTQDALGNWSTPASIALVVDQTAPVTSGVSASPNPNNGSTPLSTSVPAVRVSASFSDAATGNSNIAAAEGFIDTVGTTGTGFVFIANDGTFNSPAESGYSDIPLAVVGALSAGNHTIYVHAKDAAGNWGTTATTILVIDKTAPTISSVNLTPTTIAIGTAGVSLNVTASDTGTGVSGGQYWIDGSATPPASPTAFASTPATINTSALAAGVHTVYVRVKDGAANWSAVSSATLYVIQAVNDARTITANTSTTQTSDANAAAGVLANDQPVGLAGRTAKLASAPVRTSGTGAGTITVTCPASLGTAATPAIGGNTVCTNGAYRVTLNGVGGTAAARQASKRGTYQFTYTMTLNGVTSTATVTITVN